MSGRNVGADCSYIQIMGVLSSNNAILTLSTHLKCKWNCWQEHILLITTVERRTHMVQFSSDYLAA